MNFTLQIKLNHFSVTLYIYYNYIAAVIISFKHGEGFIVFQIHFIFHVYFFSNVQKKFLFI